MKRKNGFTMVELLGVLVIIAILAILVIPIVSNYVSMGKDTYNHKLAGQLAISGKSYYSDNKKELPTVVNKKTFSYVTVSEMTGTNFITNKFVDADGNDCSSSYVYVKEKKVNSGDYKYIPCLVCVNKKGEEINYTDEDPYCHVVGFNDTVAPTCNYIGEVSYDSDGVILLNDIKDMANDKDVGEIVGIILQSDDEDVTINTVGMSLEDIMEIDLKKHLTNDLEPGETRTYSVNLLDSGGNLSKDCLKISMVGPERENDFECEGMQNNTDVVITNATSSVGFKSMYYKVDDESAPVNIPLAPNEINALSITNKAISNVPEGANIYLVDIEDQVSEACDIDIKEPNDFECEGTRNGNTVTITKAESSVGFKSMYYLAEGGTPSSNLLTASEINSFSITNKIINNVPEDAEIYLVDIDGEESEECDIDDITPDDDEDSNQTGTTTTAPQNKPYCIFKSVPELAVSSATTVRVECQNTDGKTITLKDINKIKIKDNKKNKNGTLVVKNITKKNSKVINTAKVLKFSLKFTPNPANKKAYVAQLVVGKGTVKNKSDDKVNSSVTANINVNNNPPICEFTQTAGDDYIGSSGVTLKVKCTNPDGKKVTVKDLNKVKIYKNDKLNKKGTITVTNTTKKDGKVIKTATKLTFSIKYKPNPKYPIAKKVKVVFGEGTVKNYDNIITNNAKSTRIKVDTKPPKVSFVPTGEKGNATAINDKGSGYKTKVKVDVKCTDKHSGVKSLSVNDKKKTPPSATVTYTTRGRHATKVYCSDKLGNSVTKTKTYRVLIYQQSCSKCGIATNGKCLKSVCDGHSTYEEAYYNWYCKGYGDTKYRKSNSCSSAGATMYNSGAQCECRYEGSVTKQGACNHWKCTKHACAKGKSCWY